MSQIYAEDTLFLKTLESHKPTYFLHHWFLQNEGEQQGHKNQELHFQFSFKKKIINSFYFGYSHKAFWQVYDKKNSRSFREENYNPEVFLQFSDVGTLDYARIGLWEHESNGAKQHYDENGNEINYSRSWDRFYLYAKEGFFSFLEVGLKLWWLTSPNTDEYSSFYNDNPDLQHYMGSGELTLVIGKYPATVSIMFRKGWKEETETIRMEGRLPFHMLFNTEDQGTDFYFQYFFGYGDSLIDYNRPIRRFALGVSFR